MGFSLSDINRGRKKFTSKITKPFVKAASKISQKFIPNELRFLSPYAGGLATLMLPPTMGPLARGFAGAGFNALGQIGADESEIDDISDLNALSMALSGGLGALGSDKLSPAMNKGIETNPGLAMTGADAGEYIASGQSVPGTTGFLQGAENVGRSGIAAASDYVTGGRQNLVNLGRNPGNLFSGADKFKGARNAMSALGPTVSLATGDVAYENAIDAQEAAAALDAEEQETFDSTNRATDSNRASLQMTSMRQADIDEDTIEETLAMNNLSEYYVAPQSAAYGGMMGRNDYEFGGITEALNNAGARGLMTENNDMGGIMNGYNMGGSVLPQGIMNSKRGLVDGPGGYAGESTIRDMAMEMNSGNGPITRMDYIKIYEIAGYDSDVALSLGTEHYKTGVGQDHNTQGFNMGGSVLPQGMEMDYRQGGFIPMGSKERADDVPARVSKNEFVMTADAVRAAGGGSVNEGAKKMYEIMNNLEARA